MLLLLLIYVVLRASWKIDVYLISTLVNKSLYYTLRTEGKARKMLAIMRKLAGTTWGANEQILKTVYEGSVRPVLEYSSTTWSTAAKTN